MLIERALRLVSFVKVLRMNNTIIARVGDEKDLYREKINILASGVCKSILPMSLLHKGNSIVAYYNQSGFRRANSYFELTGQSSLMILDRLLFALEECEQFLIFPDEMVINANTVFVDEGFKTVKLTYIYDKAEVNINKKLLCFINDISQITTPDDRKYLKPIIKTMQAQTISCKQIRFVISKLILDIKKGNCF